MRTEVRKIISICLNTLEKGCVNCPYNEESPQGLFRCKWMLKYNLSKLPCEHTPEEFIHKVVEYKLKKL